MEFDQVAQRVRASFASQSLMMSVGASLQEVAPGRVVIAADVTPGFTQQHGVAHGGLVFALGDSAAGYAALTVMEGAGEVMTAEMKVNFLAPAAGQLVAEGRVIRAGRRLVVVAADVFAQADGARVAVAALMGTMVPVQPRAASAS